MYVFSCESNDIHAPTGPFDTPDAARRQAIQSLIPVVGTVTFIDVVIRRYRVDDRIANLFEYPQFRLYKPAGKVGTIHVGGTRIQWIDKNDHRFALNKDGTLGRRLA